MNEKYGIEKFSRDGIVHSFDSQEWQTRRTFHSDLNIMIKDG
jgi:hypothetical protein